MYFSFACPHCHKNLKVREETAGRKARCPYCSNAVLVPHPSLSGIDLAATPAAAPTPAAPAAPAKPSAPSFQFGAAPAAPRAAAAPPPVPAPSQEATSSGDDGTNVSMLWTAFAGFGIWVACYAVIYPLPQKLYFRQLFYDRTWVNFTEMFFTGWAAAILLFKSRKLLRQKAALLFDVLPEDISRDITVDSVDRFAQHIRSLPGDPLASFLVRRVLRGLEHFRVRRSASEVSNMLASQGAIDESNVASSYQMINVFIWAIPILGFIGTVLGLGMSVGNLSGALEGAASVDGIKKALQDITGGLGTAFDTTLLALMLSMLLKFPASSLQKSEEDALTWVSEYCNENLLKRLTESDAPSRPESPVANLQRAIDAALAVHHAELRTWTQKLEAIGTTLTQQVTQGWTGVHNELQQQHRQTAAQIHETLDAASALITPLSSAGQQLAATRQHDLQQWSQVAAHVQALALTVERNADEHQRRLEQSLTGVVERVGEQVEQLTPSLTSAVASMAQSHERQAAEQQARFEQSLAQQTGQLQATLQLWAQQATALAEQQARATWQRTSDQQVQLEQQLAQYVGQSQQNLMALTQQTQAVQSQIAESLRTSLATAEQQFGLVQQGLAALNEVLRELGGRQIIVEQVAPPSRGWGLFGRRGKNRA